MDAVGILADIALVERAQFFPIEVSADLETTEAYLYVLSLRFYAD